MLLQAVDESYKLNLLHMKELLLNKLETTNKLISFWEM